MRDLTSTELEHVYGAGGTGCSPTPPTCGKGGSKGGSKGKGASKGKGRSKAKGRSHGKGVYC